MPTVYFPSLADAEVVEIEFLTLLGGSRRLKLLVDTGFTGQSSIILGDDEDELVRAIMAPAPATGALHGEQNRAWVTCRIPEIGFQKTLIAILTGLAPLSLPDDVRGMVGLSFLRHFTRWGAEQLTDGTRFFLSVGSD
jgi:hypothetical protein